MMGRASFGHAAGSTTFIVDDDLIGRNTTGENAAHEGRNGVVLQDHDINVDRSPVETVVKTGVVTSSRPSVLHRPRPKQASVQLVRQPALFSVDSDATNSTTDKKQRPSSFFAAFTSSNSSDTTNNNVVALNAPLPGLPDPIAESTAPAEGELEDDVQQPELDEPALPLSTNRHSFYGLDQSPSSNSASPNATLDTSLSSRQPSTRDSTLNGDSASLSRSSIAGMSDVPHRQSGAAATASYRQSVAPYASSRAASVYGASTTESIRDMPLSSNVVPLLDRSHLKVGPLATLLSQEKTLDLYRANARKTSDPDIQFEFAIFCLEVVGDMDAAKLAKGAAGTSNEAELADEKKTALVSESISLLSKLATRGHVKSQYFLADCYTQGVGTPNGKRDYTKAFPLFVLAGKHGHPEACYRAGQCCEFGWGCRKDANRALQLYKRGAVFGHPESMHRLGLAELNGELGMSKKPKDGVKWLKRAAEMADQVDPPQPVSLHELALLHEKGIENVVFKDEEYAAELLARAAELQYAPSAYKLGECYEYGKMGCPKDNALSIHYYNIAAQQNHPEACFALTAWYLVGSPGVLPQSDTEAYLWALKAAELGLAKAQYAVGYFTETGSGTFKDGREAAKWYQRAARQGDKRAVQKLRQAGKPIPVDEEGSPPLAPSSAYKPPVTSGGASGGKKRMKGKQRADSVDRKGTEYRGRGAPPVSSSRSEGGHDYASSSSERRIVDRPLPELRPELPRRRSVSVPEAMFRDAAAPPERAPPMPAAPGYQHQHARPPQHQQQPPLRGYPQLNPRLTPQSSFGSLASKTSQQQQPPLLPPGAAPAVLPGRVPESRINAPLPRQPPGTFVPAPDHSPELAYTSRMLPIHDNSSRGTLPQGARYASSSAPASAAYGPTTTSVEGSAHAMATNKRLQRADHHRSGANGAHQSNTGSSNGKKDEKDCVIM